MQHVHYTYSSGCSACESHDLKIENPFLRIYLSLIHIIHLELYDWSVFKHNNNFNSNLSLVGWYLKVVFSWAHSGLAIGFPYLKLSVNCVSFYFIFHISMII